METSPQTYNGKIVVGDIMNFDIAEIPNKAPFADRHYKVVFYPDCQQLILWMPESGHLFDSITITHQYKKSVVFDRKIKDVLSGEIQIILDSQPFPPGDYQILVTREGYPWFCLFFQKFPEGVEPAVPQPEQVVKEDVINNKPTVYKDGFGNLLPDEDLLLRERVFEKIRDSFISKIQYVSTGRDGYILFTENGITARFEMEMGGGDCIFFIFLPDIIHWENNTGFSLADRDRIIDHIARMTQRDQAGGAEYKINESGIIYYSKR
jgi:hypothetical protein